MSRKLDRPAVRPNAMYAAGSWGDPDRARGRRGVDEEMKGRETRADSGGMVVARRQWMVNTVAESLVYKKITTILYLIST